jgi:Ca2+-binding RTX toxin-like protein
MNRFLRRLFGSSPRTTRPARTALGVEALEVRAVPAVDLTAAAAQLDTYLTAVSASVGKIDPSNPLPVTGQTLQSLLTGHNPVDDFRTGLVAAIKNSTPAHLQADLMAFLAKPGFTGSSASVTADTPDPAQAHTLAIDLHVKRAAAATFATDFHLGLPAVPLLITSKGDAKIQLGYDYQDLKFTIQAGNNKTTLTPDASAATDLMVSIDATLPNTANSPIRGAIGFLPVTVTDDPKHPTHFRGTFALDLDNGGAVKSARLTASAPAGQSNVNLKLASLALPGLPLPAVASDLNVAWSFNAADPKAAPTQFGDKPTAVFNHVSLAVGPTLASFASDLLGKVQTALGPLAPVIAALHTPLPIISDVGTAYDLLGSIDPHLAAFVALADDVNQLASKVQLSQVQQALAGVAVDFGSFDLGGVNTDLRDPAAAPDYLGAGKSLTKLVANGVSGLSFKGVRDQINDGLTKAGADAGTVAEVNGVLDFLDPTNPNKPVNFTLSFPFFDNTSNSLMNLIIGAGADDLVRISASINDPVDAFSVDALTLPVLPVGAAASFGGSYAIDGQITIGYDTTGLSEVVKGLFANPAGGVQVQKLADGLFITSNSHFNLTGSLSGTVVVLGPFAQFAGSGFVTADVHVSVVDTANPKDSKRYVAAAADNTPNEALLTATGGIRGEFSGTLYTEVFIFLGFVLIPTDFDTGMQSILELPGSVPNPFQPAPNVQLAHLDPGGQLRLHLGPDAGKLGFVPNNPQPQNESFTVTHDAPKAGDPAGEAVIVSAYGLNMRYAGVTSISADGGGGDDTILVGQGVTSPAVLAGGDGNDRLTYLGSANCLLYGDDPNNANAAGDDVLVGGAGQSLLFGGPGNDELTAGTGLAYLHGGAGNDKLTGGPGPGALYGEAGNDRLFAGIGSVTLDGGDGDDRLRGGAGKDTYLGGLGDDTIEWDVGDGGGSIDGGVGKDVLVAFGGTGADTFTLSRGAGGGVTLQVGPTVLTVKSTLRIDLEGGAGTDLVTVNDVATAGIDEVDIDLLQVQNPDAALDRIVVNGSAAGDAFAIANEGVTVGQGRGVPPYAGGVTRITRADLVVRAANVNDDLAVYGLDGNDTFNVTGVTGPTRLDGGNGSDAFNVSVVKPTDYAGPLTVDGGTGVNRLTVDETPPAAVNNVVTLRSASVAGTLLPNGVTYQATGGTFGGGITLKTGAGKDTVNVRDTLPGVVTAVNTSGGDDSVNVSSDAPANGGTLDGIRGTLSIDEGPGANTLNVSDRGATAGNAHVAIGAGTVSGLAGPGDATDILFGATGGVFAAVQVDGADSPSVPESFTVNGPAGPLTLRTNGGDDRVVVQALQGPAVIDTGAGSDVVAVQVAKASGYALTVNGGPQGSTAGDRLVITDASGGAVMHDHAQGGGAGTLDVFFLNGAPSHVAYSDIEAVAPSVDAEHSFVQALYHTVLGRNGTPAEVGTGVAAIQGGKTRAALADGLERSAEARTRTVNGWFKAYFGAAPTPAELTAALNLFTAGRTEEQVLAFEFTQKTTPPGPQQQPAFVKGVYQLLLKRQPTAQEILAGQALLNKGEVYGFVLSILTGLEYRRNAVAGYLGSILRQPQPPTLKQVDAYATLSLDLTAIRVQMEASPTFYDFGY